MIARRNDCAVGSVSQSEPPALDAGGILYLPTDRAPCARRSTRHHDGRGGAPSSWPRSAPAYISIYDVMRVPGRRGSTFPPGDALPTYVDPTNIHDRHDLRARSSSACAHEAIYIYIYRSGGAGPHGLFDPCAQGGRGARRRRLFPVCRCRSVPLGGSRAGAPGVGRDPPKRRGGSRPTQRRGWVATNPRDGLGRDPPKRRGVL